MGFHGVSLDVFSNCFNGLEVYPCTVLLYFIAALQRFMKSV